MWIVDRILTWWRGQTLNTQVWTALHGEKVGEDEQGNVYYKSKKGDRRWVIYNGANDASRVPAEWHGWLHHSIEGTPESSLPPPRIWEADFTPNMTGTPAAYRPSGAIEAGGRRQMATGDYEAWSPDA